MSEGNESNGGDDGADATGSEVEQDVQAGLQTAQGALSAVQAATSGDVAGVVGGAAGAAGAITGAVGGEAGAAVQTVTQAVQTAAQLAGAAQQIGSALQSGNLGGAVSGLGSAGSPSRYLLPDRDAQQVLSGAGQGLQAGSALLDGGLGDVGSALGLDRHNVSYHLELDGFDAGWGVRNIDLDEQISGLYECIVHASCDTLPEVSELLALDAHLQIERSDQMRSVRGFIKHAVVAEHETGALVVLHIVPALWLLDQNMRSRVFTDKAVPDMVEAIFQERLGGRSRSIRNDLTRTYPVHELMVQFQETDLAFIQRRLEEEGIFYYFVHDGEHEEMVLADTNTNLANARDSDEGRVLWCNPQSPPPGGEGIHHAAHFEEVGAADVVVTEYNWTAPAAPIRGERTGRSDLDPPLEVYDHTDAVLLHSYDGHSFGGNDATDQARMRAEVLDLRRQRWTLSSNVVTARPGHVIELSGCPDGSLDGRYVIVSVQGEGTSTEGESGDYSNHLQVVPADVPFRPARRTPVPSVSGFQSALVVGPDGEEIHTDEHGRVQVRFHWDREHQPSEHNLCSCWLRVMHSWAGPGFGTTFIPRIGMEVVIVFLGGNPDQPIVMGCLYHGTNPSPVATPADKTQSVIRTKSSPNSDGFNEMRFEDAAGNEFIYVHAQKDFNEVVEHNHSTHVKNDQTNTVGHDQTEHVEGEQKMTVDRNRTVHIKGSQSVTIDGAEATDGITGSKLVITGDYDIDVSDWAELEAPTRIKLKCQDSFILMEPGKITLHAGPGAEVVLDAHALMKSNDGSQVLLDADAKTSASSGGELVLTSDADLHSIAGSQVMLETNATMTSSKGAVLELTSNADMSGVAAHVVGNTEAELSAPTARLAGQSGSVEASASGVDVAGPTVNVSGQGATNITGNVVKVN